MAKPMGQQIKLITPSRIFAALGIAFLLIPSVHNWAEWRKIHDISMIFYVLYLLCLSFLFSYVANPVLFAFADKIKLVDHPDEARKKHSIPTPLTGGMAVYFAFIATMFINLHFSVEVKAIIGASTLIFLVGLIDDIWGSSAQLRLLVQVAASLIVIFFGVRVTFVPDFLGGIFTETIITMIWFIGITNAMNFIDGMDGIASGSSIIYAAFFSIVAFLTKQYYLLFFSLAVAGSCAGFLFYNFRGRKPALVFLGDSGSTFLGFLLASFAILGDWGDSIIDIVIPVLIMSVLIFDMTLTTVFRLITGEVKTFSQWLHYTGRDHLHHRLADLGITKHQATWLFFGISITFGIEALAILFADVLVSVLILVHSILTFFILGILLVLQNRKTVSHKA
jgi:UDP-GlcNAc:undecaprenyl-phosphate/decaprenyl-phosphate GlcNAc-1-phosphate transferase